MHVCSKIVSAVLLLFSVSASMPAAAMDYESMLSELQRDDWENRLMSRVVLNDRQSEDALIGLVRNQATDWRLQIRCIRLLGEMHTPRAGDALVELFNDLFFHHGCPALKTNLALALGNYTGRRVVDALISGLEDPEVQVREASIVSLGRVGDAAAVPYLVTELKDKSFTIRASAIRSLGQLRDASAISPLKKIADSDSEVLLRREALSVLSAIR